MRDSDFQLYSPSALSTFGVRRSARRWGLDETRASCFAYVDLRRVPPREAADVLTAPPNAERRTVNGER